ncbi:hypothetical protein C1645_735085 [Glomus cerebriforme]|uniref:Uncharacterized protein n=1 Tax=Glomus cerebriforme TaxID=658196 RepID=A0A397T9P1_9GLOM|nr:hypothetical protein C1645_735085 [Glomus cerebriforme]
MQMQEKIKELYSKEWVAGTLNFANEKKSKNVRSKKDKFSRNLATLLARDKETVAVNLEILFDGVKVYIAKDGYWLKNDVEYINKIQKYLTKLSEDAPITTNELYKREDVRDLLNDIFEYCSEKIETRFQKFKRDIIYYEGRNKHYVEEFLKDASIDIENIHEMDKKRISIACSCYLKKIKTSYGTPQEFFKHLKKVGSYASSFFNIISTAARAKKKILFSNIQLIELNPIRIDQPIYSWKNIIQKFISNDKYENFKNKCLKNDLIGPKLNKMYNTQLDDDDEIVKPLCLHAEMNILAQIINQERKSRVFIAVSKKCCYLCKLYIKFAKSKGYNIIISESCKKLYPGWILPFIENLEFKNESLTYILENLDPIIKDQIEFYADDDYYDVDYDDDDDKKFESLFDYFLEI